MRFILGHVHQTPGPDYIEEDRGHETKCWIWGKSIGSFGYGRIWDNEGQGHRMAHRVFYEKAHGEIPSGHDVHHHCSQPACVNPDHLEALSRREHMAADGRHPFGNKKAVVRV